MNHKNESTTFWKRHLRLPCIAGNRGAGLVEGILAMGIIGIGVGANMMIFKSSNQSLRSIKANLTFSNLKSSISTNLHSKSTLIASATGALEKCVTVSNGNTKDCMHKQNVMQDLYEPGTNKVFLSNGGVKYLLNGAIASTAKEKKLAVFEVKATSMKAYCQDGEKKEQKEQNCDLSTEVIIEYEIYPITSQYAILGVPSEGYFCKNNKCGSKKDLKPNFIEVGKAVARIADFKVDPDFTTINDCNDDNYLTKYGLKFFKPNQPEYEALSGIEKFFADGKRGKASCKPNRPDPGQKGKNGEHGATGEPGSSIRGPKGYPAPGC